MKVVNCQNFVHLKAHLDIMETLHSLLCLDIGTTPKVIHVQTVL